MKFIKKYYLLLLLIITLVGASIYGTYAMFTSSVETNMVDIDTSMTYKFKINGTQELKVSAGSKLRFNAVVENDMSGTISYGMYYKMISPSNLPSGVIIAQVSDDLTMLAKGTLDSNTSKTVPMVIKNTSDSDITVEIGVRTGYYTDSQGVDDIIYNDGEIPITSFQTSEEAGNDSCTSTVECTDECESRQVNGEWKLFCVCNTGENSVPTASGYIESLLVDNPNTMNNDDPDGNIRYMGADPNNYVSFNNELWRIIGVFDVATTNGGPTEKRLKIIRDESIGSYLWDDGSTSSGMSASSKDYYVMFLAPDAGYGKGFNNWSTASLQNYLNGDYYNTLSSESQLLIGDAVWNLGGSSTYNDVTASMFYERERGTTVYSGRPTYWVGKIGLMYPSDYGYATSGGSTTNRASCLATAIYNWKDSSYSDCKNNDYLFNGSTQWTLMPYSGYSNRVFIVYTSGYVDYNHVAYSYASRPVIYLKSDVKITGGDGSSSSPFTLGI